MKKYEGYTNEELVDIIAAGDEDAYDRLFLNMKPITISQSKIYLRKMPTYDMDDFLQEGQIVIWKIVSRGNFKGGSFANYYTSAIKFRLCNIYRDYCLKNAIVLAETVDDRGVGYNKATLAEATYAETYREKHRRHCRESYQRKKEREAQARREAGIPDPEPRKKQTKEEKAAKQKAYQQAYYAEHPEKLEERRAKMRAYEKARRERLKAEKEAVKAAEENKG